MTLNKRILFPILLSAALILTGPGGPGGPPASAQAALSAEVDSAGLAASQAGTTIYLPMVERKKGYTGQVTHLDAPVAGQMVTMLSGRDGVYSTWATATTDASGNYAFLPENFPPLGGGDVFYVRWANLTQSENYLSAWYCDLVTGAAADNTTCDIEISNINLQAPEDHANVWPPVTFRWTPRVINTDRYLVELNTRSGNAFNWVYDSPAINYTDRWAMTSLPGALQTGQQYWWTVVALGPNGYGEAFYLRAITFGASLRTAEAHDLPGSLPRGVSDSPRRLHTGQP